MNIYKIFNDEEIKQKLLNLLKIIVITLCTILLLKIIIEIIIKFTNISKQNGGSNNPFINVKELFKSTKLTVKCLGKRDGISGCRECCSKLYKSLYNTCVSNCMNH